MSPNVLRNLVKKIARTGSVHDIKKRNKIHDEECYNAKILALRFVEANPKLCFGKGSTQLNYLLTTSTFTKHLRE